MIRFRRLQDKGMTIPEILISAAIGALLVGIVLSMWYFAYRTWSVERIRTKLRTHLEIAMERIKEEVRLSSTTYMSFYKLEDRYKAISFPMATKDADGFFALDADGNIYWDRSVIYHMYPNVVTGNTELRRTEFTNNHDFLIDTAQREAQLASVLANGDGSSAPNGNKSNMDVIFQTLVDLTIEPKSQVFDGYSLEVKRSEHIGFGSIQLASGAHDFKFQVIGKTSDGYGLGIDAIAISPSGGLREIETFTPPSASSGDGYSIEPALGWSGNSYLEYNANNVDDYVTFSLYYDLWRESNFEGSVRDNTILLITGDNLYVQLANESQGAALCWQAATQTGSHANDLDAPLVSTDTATIRSILAGGNIDRDGDKVRIKFTAHNDHELTINEAWITQKSDNVGSEEWDGEGTPVQLLFGGLPSVTVPAGNERGSDWTEFSIDNSNDYFVTIHIPIASYLKYWQGAGTSSNSYWRPGNYGNYVQNNDWGDDLANSSLITSDFNIYATDAAENWPAQGTITSAVYDTKLSGGTLPNYSTISWNSYNPAGTTIDVEVHASDNADMSGATAWTAVTNGGLLPAIIDGKRYIQFKATLATSLPYTSYPWIDNVTIDWPGGTKICDISGYFTQKPDYGKIKLLVDGQELTKGFEFKITVFEYFQGQKYESSLTGEVEPRNTGK